MIVLLAVFLTLLWLLAFPMSVGFLAAVLEKRLVWPYAPLESLQPTGTAVPRDAENPFAAPRSGDPLPMTDYVEVTNRKALQLGFSRSELFITSRQSCTVFAPTSGFRRIVSFSQRSAPERSPRFP